MSNFSWARCRILIYKEYLQLMRDKSLLWAAFLLPVILLFIYGFGMRMDVEPVRLALVLQEADPLAFKIYALLTGSNYLEVVPALSQLQGQELLYRHEVDALIYLTPSGGAGPREIFAAINGTSAQGAQLSAGYIQSALQPLFAESTIQLSVRLWYNEENRSVWFLLPGQAVGVTTLVCNVVCSLVIAREFNRGTIETLLSSRLTTLEIIVGKLIPYFALSLCAAALLLTLCAVVFALPLRGSLLMLLGTVFTYCLACCIFGLWMSALVQDQFLSMEYAIIMSFLPALLLSGALFDLRAVPAPIAFIGYLLHPTYAVQSLKICYLSGGQMDVLLRNLCLLFAYCLFFFVLLYRAVAKLKPESADKGGEK